MERRAALRRAAPRRDAKLLRSPARKCRRKCADVRTPLEREPTSPRTCVRGYDKSAVFDCDLTGGMCVLLLRRFNEPEAVLNATVAHHGDVPSTTPYTPIIMAADAISASRPGARRESLERYVKRLRDLEELALGFDGVRQAYAIQAGREVRVIVDAKLIDDKISAKVARDIAKKIENEMQYPGEIKVTLIREVRSVEYAR